MLLFNLLYGQPSGTETCGHFNTLRVDSANLSLMGLRNISNASQFVSLVLLEHLSEKPFQSVK